MENRKALLECSQSPKRHRLEALFALLLSLLVFSSPAWCDAAIQISEADAKRAATVKPAPKYSDMARQMKVTGKVEVQAMVAPDGSVTEVKVVTGNSLLTHEVVNAVKEWKFTPFVKDGKPVEAAASLSFEFRQ